MMKPFQNNNIITGGGPSMQPTRFTGMPQNNQSAMPNSIPQPMTQPMPAMPNAGGPMMGGQPINNQMQMGNMGPSMGLLAKLFPMLFQQGQMGGQNQQQPGVNSMIMRKMMGR